MSYKLYCFWMGEMSEQRKYALQTLSQTGLEVVLICPDNLEKYLVEPLHEGYQYLSEAHKADYLRIYFMHYHGGGYADMKPISDDWTAAIDAFYLDRHAWILGYRESEYKCAIIKGNPDMTQMLQDRWYDLIGNGAYVCKPRTPFTTDLYRDMIQKITVHLDQLKQFPAKNPYPFDSTDLRAQLFHPLVHQYRNLVCKTLPRPSYSNYM